MGYFVHQSALVDDGALISVGCKIWHWSHICSGAKIGENTTLGQNVYVGSKAIIGNRVKVQNNVSIYDNVVIDDDVFCGPSMVFTNVYNPRAFIERKNEYRKTFVRQGASLGANCTLVCGIEVGRYALIGAGTVVKSDVPDFALFVGVPGRQIGWVSRFGERLSLPLTGNKKALCPHTGDIYELKGDKLVLLETPDE